MTAMAPVPPPPPCHCCLCFRPGRPVDPIPALPCPACPLPCSIAKMLFCTSLVAFVGAGEQPHLTPRKLTLLNSHSNAVIQALSFPSSVLGVHLNRKRCVRPYRGMCSVCAAARQGSGRSVGGWMRCVHLRATRLPTHPSPLAPHPRQAGGGAGAAGLCV